MYPQPPFSEIIITANKLHNWAKQRISKSYKITPAQKHRAHELLKQSKITFSVEIVVEPNNSFFTHKLQHRPFSELKITHHPLSVKKDTIKLIDIQKTPQAKQPKKVYQHNISTPKTGIQDLVVIHYDCSPMHITNMQYYELNKIGECKIKPADLQVLPAQVQIFSQIRTLKVRAYSTHAELSDKESFCHKISLKRGFRFDHDNWYVNNMERSFFPTEIEARRELARIGLISKHHYHPQIKQFDILSDSR